MNMQLRVRVGQTTSEPFRTKMGVPQGDCLSPILFSLYLTKALEQQLQKEDPHSYTRPSTENTRLKLPSEMRDHTYRRNVQEYGMLIRPKYADDIGWVAANAQHRMEVEKAETLPKLENRGLRINIRKNRNIHHLKEKHR